jgi:hypothetical protein
MALDAHLPEHAIRRLREVVEVFDGLGDEVTHPSLERPDHRGLVAEAGNQDHGQVIAGGAHLGVEVEPIDVAGQMVIDQEQIQAAATDVAHCLFSRGRDQYGVARRLKALPLQLGDAGVVLDDQDGGDLFGSHPSSPTLGRLRAEPGRWRGTNRGAS